MMTCSEWHDHLIERLYGEISPESDAALSEHLEGCEGCRGGLAEFQRVRRQLQDDAGDLPRGPRVVVLRDRSRYRTALMAASLLGAAVLAGAGAGAGYALGVARVPSSAAISPTKVGADTASTAELVRQEVNRRLAALESAHATAPTASFAASDRGPAADRPVSAADLRAEFAKFERRLNGTREADLDYVLDQIAALASTPYASEQ
jgi:predicted anti-sigma-YlaC factor YlaD